MGVGVRVPVRKLEGGTHMKWGGGGGVADLHRRNWRGKCGIGSMALQTGTMPLRTWCDGRAWLGGAAVVINTVDV